MILLFEALTAVDPCNAEISNSNVVRGWICLHIALHCFVFCIGGSYGMDQNVLEKGRTKYLIIRSFGIINQYSLKPWGPRSCSWLRHCATNRQVAGSIFDGVSGFSHWHNPAGRTMALVSTQPLTEMSTRNTFWGVKAAGA
jgi:hypothetical protein